MPGRWFKKQLERELKEKREILTKFWEERIVKPNEKAIAGFKDFLIKQHPERAQEIEKLFAVAIATPRSIDCSGFLAGLEFLPLADVVAMNHFEKLIDLPNPPKIKSVSAITITKKKVRDIQQFMSDAGMSAVVAIGNAKEGSFTPVASTGNSSSDVFCMHSIGKVFTGMLMFKMFETGVFTEGDLNKVGVGLDPTIMTQLSPTVQERLKTVTLHQLMTHNAGLGDYLYRAEENQRKGQLKKIERIDELLQFVDEEVCPTWGARYRERGYSYRFMSSDGKYVPQEGEIVFDLVDNNIIVKMQGTADFSIPKIPETKQIYEVVMEASKRMKAGKKEDVFTPEEKEQLSRSGLIRRWCIGSDQHWHIDLHWRPDYSNAGMLLVGFAIEHAYAKKYGEHLNYYQLLQKYVTGKDGADLSSFSLQMPEGAKYGDTEHPANAPLPYLIGSPGGGSWISAEDLAKFVTWIYEEYNRTDSKLGDFLQKYGQEFCRNFPVLIIEHGGAGNVSSADVLMSLVTGSFMVILSEQPWPMLFELKNTIMSEIFAPAEPKPGHKVGAAASSSSAEILGELGGIAETSTADALPVAITQSSTSPLPKVSKKTETDDAEPKSEDDSGAAKP